MSTETAHYWQLRDADRGFQVWDGESENEALDILARHPGRYLLYRETWQDAPGRPLLLTVEPWAP